MSIDFSDPRIQELIRAQVAAQLEAASKPAAPKELTSEEKATAAVEAAYASVARDGNRTIDHIGAILVALRALLDHVTGSSQASSQASASTGVTTVGSVGADAASATEEGA